MILNLRDLSEEAMGFMSLLEGIAEINCYAWKSYDKMIYLFTRKFPDGSTRFAFLNHNLSVQLDKKDVIIHLVSSDWDKLKDKFVPLLRKRIEKETEKISLEFDKACAISHDGEAVVIADQVIVKSKDHRYKLFDTSDFTDNKVILDKGWTTHSEWVFLDYPYVRAQKEEPTVLFLHASQLKRPVPENGTDVAITEDGIWFKH